MSARLLTVPETADRLRISRRTVERLIRAGDLPARKVGRFWRVDETELAEFIESLPTNQPGDAA